MRGDLLARGREIICYFKLGDNVDNEGFIKIKFVNMCALFFVIDLIEKSIAMLLITQTKTTV